MSNNVIQVHSEIIENERDGGPFLPPRMDKTVVRKYKLGEEPKDIHFWRTQSYEARLAALEDIRRSYNAWKYGVEQGFQRVYRIVERT
jgi:hypothetical protein